MHICAGIKWMSASCEIALNDTEHLWWWVNIDSGNGLAPSGNKPLPELILIHYLCQQMVY